MKHEKTPHVCRILDHCESISLDAKDSYCEKLEEEFPNLEFSVTYLDEYLWKFADCGYDNVWFPLDRINIRDEIKARNIIKENLVGREIL